MTVPPPTPQLDHARLSRAHRALLSYRALSLQVFDTQASHYASLPPKNQAQVPGIPVRLSHAAEAIEHNADVLDRVAHLTGMKHVDPATMNSHEMAQSVEDFPDVVDALLAIVRDWSDDGASERDIVYTKIVDSVVEAAMDAVSTGAVDQKKDFGVLVVGAGVGRLSWEIARDGFYVQGVESSYLLLFWANYVLNGEVGGQSGMHLYPWAHHTGMVEDVNEQCKEVTFPDCKVREVGSGNFTMVAGEFLDLYNEDGGWDCVVTCFYLESCHSIISVVRRVAKILREGGVWVNFGGLEFRYEDSEDEPSIEVTAEELDLIIGRAGMRVLKRESVACKPPFSVGGMIEETVDACFTVAVKL